MLGTLILATIVILIILLVLRYQERCRAFKEISDRYPYPTWQERLAVAKRNNLLIGGFELHKVLHEWHTKYGPTIGFFNFFGQHKIITADWDVIKHVMGERKLFPRPLFFREAVNFKRGVSMFTSEGLEWETRHNTLAPLMRFDIIRYHYENVHSNVQELIRKMVEETEKTGGKALDAQPYLYGLSLNIVGKLVFDLDFESISLNPKKFPSSDGKVELPLRDILDARVDAFRSRIALPLWMWKWPLPRFEREKKSIAVLKGVYEKSLVRQKYRREAVEEGRKEDFPPITLISLLLDTVDLEVKKEDGSLSEATRKAIARKFCYKELKDMLGECFAFFAAGHDALNVAMGFQLYVIALDQRVQAKAREEADALMKETLELGLEKPTFDMIDTKTPYITKTLREALRLYGGANLLDREVEETHEYNGFRFTKGTEVLANTYSYHRLAFGEDFDKFRPERYDSGSPDENKPHFGFGYGMRACFGRRLALMIVRVLCIQMLSNYELSIDPERPCIPEFHFGLRPNDNKTFIKIRPRSDRK
eukprot:TRINITY_DN10181_c0_g1_i1.p1 TRINITY_DN10181_c0_g1~~TRINITY_DN10181_c0_g1_i1.p1  ORF type:complete len:536 (-),score=75.71 TRINITY_DN10181_c0_g1_i1:97-1704(-)